MHFSFSRSALGSALVSPPRAVIRVPCFDRIRRLEKIPRPFHLTVLLQIKL